SQPTTQTARGRTGATAEETNWPGTRPGGQKQWQGRKNLHRVCIYRGGAPKQPAAQGGSQWHSSRITVETGPSDRGQPAHAPRKSKEKRRRRLPCAKPSARQRKPRRMRSKRPGSLEGYWFREHRHSCAENASAIAFGVGSVSDLHTRAQCARGRSSTANLQ